MGETKAPRADAGAFVPILLAAGRGRRLGGPKALVEIEGRIAVELCLEACARGATTERLAAPIVVIGHGAMQVAAELSARLHRLEPLPLVVRNRDPDRGQTSSVRVGLEHVSIAAAGVLIFPVDHPLVEATDIAALLEAAATHPTAPVILPSHGGRAGHPALVRAALHPAIMALGDGEPLYTVIRAAREQTVFVDRPRPGVVLDIDTPADLERARMLAREHRTPNHA